jgi:flagellar motor component MotA
VTLQSLVDSLIADTVARSLPLFRPELALCVAIVALLLAKVIPPFDRIPPFAIALIGAIAALVVAVPLTVFAIVLGVYPQSVLNYMQPSVNQQVDQLAAWTQKHDATNREALRPSQGEDQDQMAVAERTAN